MALPYPTILLSIASVVCTADFNPLFVLKDGTVIGTQIDSDQRCRVYALHPQDSVPVQALSAFWRPSDLQALPSGEGWSFIDDGRVRIQYPHKRSPKTCDWYVNIQGIAPCDYIFNITKVWWETDTTAYIEGYVMQPNAAGEPIVEPGTWFVDETGIARPAHLPPRCRRARASRDQGERAQER